MFGPLQMASAPYLDTSFIKSRLAVDIHFRAPACASTAKTTDRDRQTHFLISFRVIKSSIPAHLLGLSL